MKTILILLLLALLENFYLYHNLFKTNQSKKGLETDIILRNKEKINEPNGYLEKSVNRKSEFCLFLRWHRMQDKVGF